jgi:hypothetical protein
VQDVLVVVELERVPRVGPSLETGYDIITGGQYVHDFPFSLVPPLEAQKHIDFHDF